MIQAWWQSVRLIANETHARLMHLTATRVGLVTKTAARRGDLREVGGEFDRRISRFFEGRRPSSPRRSFGRPSRRW